MKQEELKKIEIDLKEIKILYKETIQLARIDKKVLKKVKKQLTSFKHLIYECQKKLEEEQEVNVSKSSPDCKDCDTIKFGITYPDLKSLWAIARYFKIDLDQLKDLNPNWKQLNKGSIIYLPKGTLTSKNCNCKGDSFKFLEDNQLTNLWRVAQHYDLNYDELINMNKHLEVDNMHKGDIVCLPKNTLKNDKTPSKNKNVGGDPNGKKTVLISWTFDDGPVPVTDDFREDFEVEHTTFFIVKSNMLKQTGGWDANIKQYKAWIKQGATVGIHAQHPTIDHILWFPASGVTSYKNYESIEKAMEDLKTFKKELNKEKIYPRFVRPPGGLASQLESYAKYFKLSDVTSIRNAIIAGKGFESLSLPKTQKDNYNKIAKDYTYLKTSLEQLGLFLWKGTVNPNQINPQSWQAASSGTAGMDDDITYHLSVKKEREKTGLKQSGKFEKLVDKMKDGETKSLVILAHDTSAHTTEALKDKEVMEKYAKDNGVRIEYVNLSELFKKVTGKDADKTTPDY